jgi:hypothetical protein
MSTHDLNRALAEQTHTGELLGQVLVRAGILDGIDIIAVLSIQEHIERPEDAVKLAAGIRQMLGSLLIEAGQITPEQLEQAIGEQRKTGEKLGEVLVRLGLLSERQLNSVLDFQQNQSGERQHPSPLRLGELLVSTGQITSEQLQEALLKQAASRKKLGEVLVEEGYVRPNQVKRGLRIMQMLSTSALVAAVSLGSLTGCGGGGAQAQTGSAISGVQAVPANAQASEPLKAGPAELNLALYTKANPDGSTVIHIPAGTYRVSKTLVLPSNTILEGDGDTTILETDASFTGSQFITNSDFTNGNSNIIIQNLKMEVSLPLLPGDSPGVLRFANVEQLEIDKLTMVLNSPMYGIDLSSYIRNATVQGCTITNTSTVGGGGIMIRNEDPLPAQATSGIVIRNNQVASASDESIAAFGWLGLTENVRIENNTLLAQGASFGITAYGFNSPGQSGQISNVNITGNSVVGSTVGAIGIMGGANGVNVTDNTVMQTQADGIFLDPGGDGLPVISNINVQDNTISNVGRNGIFANGMLVQVQQNKISNCSRAGIYAVAGVAMIGNVISDAHPGILVQGESDATISGNTLSNAGEIVFLQ